ncbi:MAG TPA: alcohol dehydrogenase catalytic domain-containing protein, partial [Candidatus Nitrosotenuis sp.]|nr:alcohol dehydrogenase catalytic domain-containing protein [Candidatus Nitrosotenuis sp.]
MMLSAYLPEPRRLEMRQVEVPRPGPGEILVRVRCALTCGLDLAAWRGRLPWPGDRPLGHEFAGEVAALGPGVTGFAEGDAVMAAPAAPCGDCPHCTRGLENLCSHLGAWTSRGAFSEFVLLSPEVVRRCTFPKPASLSFAQAAMLEPLARVVQGLALVPFDPLDTLVILGSGAIGLLHLAVARARGAGRILVAGRGAERLAAARRLGADRVIDIERESAVEAVAAETGGRGAELV